MDVVIFNLCTSGTIRSELPPWRVCEDRPDGKRPPVTDQRFHSPKEAQEWVDKERAAGRL